MAVVGTTPETKTLPTIVTPVLSVVVFVNNPSMLSNELTCAEKPTTPKLSAASTTKEAVHVVSLPVIVTFPEISLPPVVNETVGEFTLTSVTILKVIVSPTPAY